MFSSDCKSDLAKAEKVLLATKTQVVVVGGIHGPNSWEYSTWNFCRGSRVQGFMRVCPYMPSLVLSGLHEADVGSLELLSSCSLGSMWGSVIARVVLPPSI